MKNLFVTLFLITLTTSLCANEPERIAAQIAPLINDSVVAVGHIDLQAVDIEKLYTKHQSVISSLGGIFPLFGPKLSEKEFVDLDLFETEKKNATAGLAEVKKLGIRDAYFLYAPSVSPQSLFVVAPLQDEAATEKAYQFFSQFVRKKHGKFLISLGVNPGTGPENETIILDQFLAQKPVARPELLTALKAAPGTTAQVALIPPPFFKRILEETMKTLPAPFESVAIQTVTRGILWTVIGIDLDKPELALVIQSEQEQAAKEFSALLDKVADFSAGQLFQNIGSLTFLGQANITETEAQKAAKILLPKQTGSQLKLTVNETFVKENYAAVSAKVVQAAVDAAQLEARRSVCVNHLKQIVLSLQIYHDVHQTFPPAWTVGKDDKPLHSWRVHILPFVEQLALYKSIRLDEPWDSDHNKQFHDKCPAIFQCPEMASKNSDIKKNGLTSYSIIVGKSAYPPANKRFELSMVTDGTSNTIGIVERKTPVCWMDPANEIDEEEAFKGIDVSDKGIGAPHPSLQHFGVNTGYLDGSVRYIMKNITERSLKAAITRNGSETYPIEYGD